MNRGEDIRIPTGVRKLVGMDPVEQRSRFRIPEDAGCRREAEVVMVEMPFVAS